MFGIIYFVSLTDFHFRIAPGNVAKQHIRLAYISSGGPFRIAFDTGFGFGCYGERCDDMAHPLGACRGPGNRGRGAHLGLDL